MERILPCPERNERGRAREGHLRKPFLIHEIMPIAFFGLNKTTIPLPIPPPLLAS